MAKKGSKKQSERGKLTELLRSLGPTLQEVQSRITAVFPAGVPLRTLRRVFRGAREDMLLALDAGLLVLTAGALVLTGAPELTEGDPGATAEKRAVKPGKARGKSESGKARKESKRKHEKRAAAPAQPDPAGLERVRRSIARSLAKRQGQEEREDDERVSVHVKLSDGDFGTEADIKLIERFDGEVQQALAHVKAGYAGDSVCGGGYYDLEYRGRSRKRLLASIRPLFEQSLLPGESYLE